jgi:hypothetical protein
MAGLEPGVRQKRKVCDSPMQSLSRILEATDIRGSRPPVAADFLGQRGATKSPPMSATSSPFSGTDDDSFKRRVSKASDDITWSARRAWSVHHRDSDADHGSSESDSRTATNLQRAPCVTDTPLLSRAPVQPSRVDAAMSSSVVQTLGLAPSTSRQRAAGLTALSSLSVRR